MAAILFALRYGTIFGLISFGVLLLYKVVYTGFVGGDIFLLFYDTNSLLTLFYYFAITVIVGLFSTSFRERYEISQFRNEELKDENTYLKETVDLLNTSQTTLRQKLLQSEYSLNQLYELAVSLDLPHPELIRSETIRLLKKIFPRKRRCDLPRRPVAKIDASPHSSSREKRVSANDIPR